MSVMMRVLHIHSGVFAPNFVDVKGCMIGGANVREGLTREQMFFEAVLTNDSYFEKKVHGYYISDKFSAVNY